MGIGFTTIGGARQWLRAIMLELRGQAARATAALVARVNAYLAR
jgi:hypothetical protein